MVKIHAYLFIGQGDQSIERSGQEEQDDGESKNGGGIQPQLLGEKNDPSPELSGRCTQIAERLVEGKRSLCKRTRSASGVIRLLFRHPARKRFPVRALCTSVRVRLRGGTGRDQMDARIQDHIGKLQQDYKNPQQIGEGNHNLDDDHEIANLHGFPMKVGKRVEIERSYPRPGKDPFQGDRQLPKANQAGGKTGNDIGKGGAQNIARFQCMAIQPFCACQVYVVFFRIDYEERPPGVDELEQQT